LDFELRFLICWRYLQPKQNLRRLPLLLMRIALATIHQTLQQWLMVQVWHFDCLPPNISICLNPWISPHCEFNSLQMFWICLAVIVGVMHCWRSVSTTYVPIWSAVLVDANLWRHCWQEWRVFTIPAHLPHAQSCWKTSYLVRLSLMLMT